MTMILIFRPDAFLLNRNEYYFCGASATDSFHVAIDGMDDAVSWAYQETNIQVNIKENSTEGDTCARRKFEHN